MRIFTVLLCLFLAVPAWAGPFGTEMGDSPDKFADLEKIEQHGWLEAYSTSKPPQKHSDFEYYMFGFYEAGLVIVIATTRDFSDDNYGFGAKAQYYDIKKQLTDKYGKPVSTEKLNAGSIWDGPREFATSINVHDRVHKSVWLDKLPDNLESIKLEVLAKNKSTTYVQLHYVYKDMVKVRTKTRAENQGAL